MDLTCSLAESDEKARMVDFFAQYLKEMRYLRNFSERTLHSYGQLFDRWQKYVGTLPSEQAFASFVVGMRETGLSPVTCKISIRAFNAFLTWRAGRGGPGH